MRACGEWLWHNVRSNENKMSDGGQGRASIGVKVGKSSQKWSVQLSAVRSIAWLGDLEDTTGIGLLNRTRSVMPKVIAMNQ